MSPPAPGKEGKWKFPSWPDPGWAAGAGSLGVRSLEATSGLAFQCPFILETEVDSPEVGTGWLWGFLALGASLVAPLCPTPRMLLFRI